jgi:hypothetical protein
MSQQQLFSTPQTEMTSDDCYTPPEVFERLGVVFDVDVCAPPGGVPWIPAKSYLTQAENGLQQIGLVMFGLTRRLAMLTLGRKVAKHANGIALLPCQTTRVGLETCGTSTAKVAWIKQN